jgi:hypothetical protein
MVANESGVKDGGLSGGRGGVLVIDEPLLYGAEAGAFVGLGQPVELVSSRIGLDRALTR